MKYLLACIVTTLILNSTVGYKRLEQTLFEHKNFDSIQIDSLLILRQNDSLLTSFYRTNNFNTYWNAQSRNDIIGSLSRASADGLIADDYWQHELKNFEIRKELLTSDEIVDFDIMLTQSIQKLLSHLLLGKLDPGVLYEDWILERNLPDINLLITQGPNINDIVNQSRPQHHFYKSLQNALIEIDTYPEHSSDTIAFTGKILVNERNSVMIDIKRRLIYWKDLANSDSLTSKYDRPTSEAVIRFQKRHGLKPDAIIGPATIATLNISKQHRKEQIISNLERWRWFPREMGDHYVIVNIPSFKLAVVKGTDTVETKKIVVGTLERKTPVLSSTFSNIVLNPTWTVPPTILKEDLVPSAIKSRRYFAEKKITIYDRNNVVVSPYHWNPAKATNYRYVQTPGDHNALGNVKFDFPNNMMVYLHDTNTKSYFSRSNRSLSSGCVRVEDPLPLAVYLLNDQGWTLDKIEQIVESRKTTNIALKDRIKLHQLYWTAWMDRQGALIFRHDIYNLDKDLYIKLRS